MERTSARVSLVRNVASLAVGSGEPASRESRQTQVSCEMALMLSGQSTLEGRDRNMRGLGPGRVGASHGGPFVSLT